MSEPTTAAGRTLRQTLGYIVTADLATVPEMIDVDDDILAIEAEARAAALDEARAAVDTAFHEYLWGLSISPQPAAGPCEESVRNFHPSALAAIDALREDADKP